MLNAGRTGAATVIDPEKVALVFQLNKRDLPTALPEGIAIAGFLPREDVRDAFISHRFKSIDDLAPDDWRRNSPRFQGDNFAKNLALVDKVTALARDRRCKPHRQADPPQVAKADAELRPEHVS